MEKLASLSGHKTKASTNTAFHRLKNKLTAFGVTNEDAEEADVDADGDADAEDTPAPVVKKGRGKKAAVVKAEEPATDEDDEPKAATAKPKAKGKARASRASTSMAVSPKSAPKGRTTRASLRARKSMPTGDTSADEDEVKKSKPIALKVGRAKHPKIEDVQIEPATAGGAADESAAGAEVCRSPLCSYRPMLINMQEATADANALKRAATEPASDIDELAQPERVKRVKHDNHNDDLETSVSALVDNVVDTVVDATVNAVLKAAVETVATYVSTNPTIVSTNPTIESFVVNDPDAVDVADEIVMHPGYQPAPDLEDRPGADIEDGLDIRSDVASAADSGEHDI